MRHSSGPEGGGGTGYRPGPLLVGALVDWAVPRAEISVLDPECGPGDLLRAAVERSSLLGDVRPRVVGAAGSPEAAAAAENALAGMDAEARVLAGSILEVAAEEIGTFDAVVSAPRFVRYSQLGTRWRELAAARARQAGVRLAPLSGSWAATLVHACSFLRPGGRLAFVAPAELATATYGKRLLGFLVARFGRLRLVALDTPAGRRTDQDLLVVLGDAHGRRASVVEVGRIAEDAVPGRASGGLTAVSFAALDAADLTSGRTSLREAWLEPGARSLLGYLRTSRRVSRLGQHAKVASGYVTGANEYFHLRPDEALDLGIEAPHLRRALFRSRALKGLEFTMADWAAAAEEDDAGLLLSPTTDADPAVAAYLEQGLSAGIAQRAKARHRRLWWRVTRTSPPELVMTALVTRTPRIAVNSAQAAVPNTLHAVSRRPGSGSAAALTLVAAARSSLTALSAELVGKPMGGGLLKLEPSAAQLLWLPLPAGPSGDVPAVVLGAIDRAARAGDDAAAMRAADAAFLSGIAGVGQEGAQTLREAARTLLAERT